MTLESLGEFFKSDSSRQPLQRIYLAQKIQSAIEEQLGEKLKIILKPPKIILVCQTQPQAAAISRQLKRIYGISAAIIGEGKKLTVSVRVDPTTGP